MKDTDIYIDKYQPEHIKELTPIQTFYKDTVIFITGSTGFLGQLLLEKLLRSCTNISTIYILVRNKKGKDVQSRVDEILDNDVFKKVSETNPKLKHKVVAVAGDCSLPNLGLSDQDRNTLINEVNVVFHVAATVRFDEKIKTAVNINIRATQDIINMAKKMKQLKCFVHVSTAYANCTSKVIEEKIYPPAIEYKKMFNITESISEEMLTKMTPILIDKYPNTYAFTKQIAENVVQELGKGLPIGIFRPSIVISTYHEPLEGWINNVYGPTGVLTGAGLGLLRILHCDGVLNANIIPADMTVNSLIASAWDIVERKKIQNGKLEKIPVYNYENTTENPITWNWFMDAAKRYGEKWPVSKLIWYYCFFLQKNFFLYSLSAFFLHTVPAFLVDFVLLCSGKSPKLVKAFTKIHKFSEVISYFCTQTWIFKSYNVRELCDKMSVEDQKIFFSDLKQIDWEKYFDVYIRGIRLYLLNDPLDTLAATKIKYRRLYWAHQALKLVLVLLALRLLWFIMTHILNIF